MKSSNQHILETLIINKDYRDASISPKSFYELRKIIVDRYFKLGPGTKKIPLILMMLMLVILILFVVNTIRDYLKEQILNTSIYRIGMFQM